MALLGSACSSDPAVWSGGPNGSGAPTDAGRGGAATAGAPDPQAGRGGSYPQAGRGGAGGGGARPAGNGGSDGGGAGEPVIAIGGQPPVRPDGGAGQDGGGGEPPVVGPGSGRRLGRACVNDAQCGPGLGCVTATSGLLDGGSPPKGVCTVPCEDDDACEALSPGSLCSPFGSENAAGFCLEGCSFGDPGIGASKCHDRPELACLPARLVSTDEPCDDLDDCSVGDVCSDGVCQRVLAACLPSCRGDLDCAEGLYCDQSFLGGTCVSQKPVGKVVGAPCTVPGPTAPAEPDECLGFCQPDAGSSTSGHCSTTCGLGAGCAWDSVTKKFGGACLYASALTAETGSVGDFGFCTPACNCTEECSDLGLTCTPPFAGGLGPDYAGPGLCFSADSSESELESCP